MPNWKKIIYSGSNASLNDVTISGDLIIEGDIFVSGSGGALHDHQLYSTYTPRNTTSTTWATIPTYDLVTKNLNEPSGSYEIHFTGTGVFQNPNRPPVEQPNAPSQVGTGAPDFSYWRLYIDGSPVPATERRITHNGLEMYMTIATHWQEYLPAGKKIEVQWRTASGGKLVLTDGVFTIFGVPSSSVVL